MKKKTLIVSTALLLVAIMCLATASYAWFTSNASVSAGTLNVKINSANGNLIIGTANDLTAIQAAKAHTADITLAEAASLNPVALKTDASAETVSTVAAWYYEKATSTDASTGDGTQLAPGALAGYVATADVYVCTATGTPNLTNLKATVSGNTAPIKVAVASATVLDTTPNGTTALAETVTDTALVKVTLYVWYDGTDATVFTDNIANIANGAIGITLTATEPTA